MTAPASAGSLSIRFDQPADRWLFERAETLSGWLEVDEGEFALGLRCGGRELAVRPCRHPSAPLRRGVHGFWSMLFLQEHLDEVAAGSLLLEVSWRGRACGSLRLRVTPIAQHLAREYPLDLRVHPVPPEIPAPTSATSRGHAADRSPHPTVEFPGLGGVGGASLNQLVRLQLLREGGALPVYFEADQPRLWEGILAADPPSYRWIDGHACYGAAARLGRPFLRLVLLREPLRRLVSIHDYNALVHPDRHRFASFEEFVESGAARLASQAFGLLRLAGVEADPRASDREVAALACAELTRRDSLVGITEHFEESIFLVAQAMGLASIGMWWRVLSAPRSQAVDELPLRLRRAAERAVAADRLLYEEGLCVFHQRTAALARHPAVERYRRESGARREIPDVLRAVECLRWRQRLAEAERPGRRPAVERAS